eukprot:TRINITY_DN15694_c0_g1_i1.p1 TRINITY_DN15694_c0_g1~~TRINITY_DN15694_c0_g1_i1.p1  ORF type:complete len:152 (+),score=10.01 TRINITY_DN15694_c0_g1_i1:14-469(+)
MAVSQNVRYRFAIAIGFVMLFVPWIFWFSVNHDGFPHSVPYGFIAWDIVLLLILGRSIYVAYHIDNTAVECHHHHGSMYNEDPSYGINAGQQEHASLIPQQPYPNSGTPYPQYAYTDQPNAYYTNPSPGGYGLAPPPGGYGLAPPAVVCTQ